MINIGNILLGGFTKHRVSITSSEVKEMKPKYESKDEQVLANKEAFSKLNNDNNCVSARTTDDDKNNE